MEIVATGLAATLLAGCGTTRENEANWDADRLYAEARQEQDNGNYERAGKLYERLEGRAAGTLLSQQAQLERAYANYRTGEKATALSILERFIKLHPTSPAADYALYLQGVVNFNDDMGLLGNIARQDLSERDQQASRDAFQSFSQLVSQYPQSRYAPDARLRMAFIVNALANYEVHVARYYYRRGAYIAAVNRAQQTVQDFNNANATEEALAIMSRSYDKLGLVQLRDDANRVLKANYPNSRFLDTLDRPEDRHRRWWQFW